MQARRASRELALILFSQLEKNLEKYGDNDFEKIVLKSVRTLISSSQEELNIATSGLSDIAQFIDEYENNHPENLKRPIDAHNIPVQIPLTKIWVIGNYWRKVCDMVKNKILAVVLLIICFAIHIGIVYFIGRVVGTVVPFK